MKFLKILCFLFVTASNGQTYNTVVSDGDIDEVILYDIAQSENYSKEFPKISPIVIHWNKVMPDDDPSEFSMLSKMLMQLDTGDPLQEIGELFNNADLEYMEMQFDAQQVSQWQFPSREKGWADASDKKQVAYSTPLFDRHHKTAIVYKEVKCGKKCRHFSFELFIRKDVVWELYKSVSVKKTLIK